MEELSILNMQLEVISPFIWTPTPLHRCGELKFIFHEGGSFFIWLCTGTDDSDWKTGRHSVLIRPKERCRETFNLLAQTR